MVKMSKFYQSIPASVILRDEKIREEVLEC